MTFSKTSTSFMLVFLCLNFGILPFSALAPVDLAVCRRRFSLLLSVKSKAGLSRRGSRVRVAAAKPLYWIIKMISVKHQPALCWFFCAINIPLYSFVSASDYIHFSAFTGFC
jgi:hypothetical protein